jgi:hypothetical protein
VPIGVEFWELEKMRLNKFFKIARNEKCIKMNK